MLTKITRKDCLKKFPAIPHTSLNRNKIYYPQTVKNYTLTVDAKSIRSYVNNFSKESGSLFQLLGFESLIFLGDNGLPWLKQDHDYAPVKNALTYLQQNKVTKSFNGGLLVNREELLEFIKQIFWLIRCCAALPYFHFTDENQNVVGNICQYGNLHLDTLNRTIDKKFNASIKSVAFIRIPAMSCTNKFGKTSAIRNRRTIV